LYFNWRKKRIQITQNALWIENILQDKMAWEKYLFKLKDTENYYIYVFDIKFEYVYYEIVAVCEV
jgi:hypothetical protein